MPTSGRRHSETGFEIIRKSDLHKEENISLIGSEEEAHENRHEVPSHTGSVEIKLTRDHVKI